MVRLAVVVDDSDLRQEMLTQLLHFGVHACAVGGEGNLRQGLFDELWDLVIVDSRLLDGDGYKISSRLKEVMPVGVILLGEAGTVEERIRSFRAGVDLYLAKPVDYAELAAAVDNLARRLRPLRQQSGAASAGEETERRWFLDEVKWELLAPDGNTLRLTGGEFRFLACIMAWPGRAVARHEIIKALGYGELDYDPRSLDAVVRRLRRKAEIELGYTLPIRAVHSMGYVFTAPVRTR